jgi:hypothetical protein
LEHYANFFRIRPTYEHTAKRAGDLRSVAIGLLLGALPDRAMLGKFVMQRSDQRWKNSGVKVAHAKARVLLENSAQRISNCVPGTSQELRSPSHLPGRAVSFRPSRPDLHYRQGVKRLAIP